MTDVERPVFGAAEVIEIASKFEADDDAFIIGGQATNFWAWFFQNKEPELKLKEGRPMTVLIKVLHPLLCLKSRIINMLHPATRRTDRIARTQAEAALVIVRRFISDSLNDPNGWKEARGCFATLYWYLRSDEYVKIADAQLSIDGLAIIWAFVEDERIDQRYRELQLKKMIANIERRRACRR